MAPPTKTPKKKKRWRVRFMDQLTQRLLLNQQQRQQILQILKKHSPTYRRIKKEMRAARTL